MFGIKCQVKEARTNRDAPLVHEGEWVWLVKSRWVPATSSVNLSKDIITFENREEAEEFAKEWKGHPWYHMPNGNYEIVEVIPEYKKLTGYHIAISSEEE